MFYLTDLHLTTQKFMISVPVTHISVRSKAYFWECGHQVLPLPSPQCRVPQAVLLLLTPTLLMITMSLDITIWLTVVPPQKWILYHCSVGHQPEQSRQAAYGGTTQTTIKSSVVHVYMIGISCTDCWPWHQMEKYFIMSHFPFLIPSLLLLIILCRSVFPDTCSSVTDHIPDRHKPVRNGSKFFIGYKQFLYCIQQSVFTMDICVVSSGNLATQSTQSIK